MILLDLARENNIYNNYSHTARVDWKIEKTTEAYPKKLESNIDKLETGLKKIDFNSSVNDDEIDNMDNKEAVHSSDGLTDDECGIIE